ncbi:MAG TPA: gliding motility-associated C-terminal domain-containing protein [Saprospiraceae bacterium]|nr:gliding motility-associated C-terminal domain-containing protein [Saprospiraceae bacterium]
MKNLFFYTLATPIVFWLALRYAPSRAVEPTALADPPVFIDPAPADTTVRCLNDIPIAPGLRATDDNDPSFPKTIFPVDVYNPTVIDPCVGGTITRRWVAQDVVDNLSTTLTQIITIAPDTVAPMVRIPEPVDTALCTNTDYATWLNNKRLALATNIDECNLDGISDDAPASFNVRCGSVTVTFTLTDECGNSSQWQATYTIIDNQAPQLIGLPADTAIVIGCNDPIPPAPSVTAVDNCTPNLVVAFNEASGQTQDSTCSQYDYVIIRSWSVTDSCGNTALAVQRITVRDNDPPSFISPPDITLDCSDDPSDLSLTGNATNVTDDCTPEALIRLTFEDVISDSICPQGYVIQRVWQAIDLCNNILSRVQFITITDTEAPTFAVPEAIAIRCDQSPTPTVTGAPTQVTDNCDPNPIIEAIDVIQAGPCMNSYTIRRTWRVSDACGNATEQLQIITVADEEAPQFITPARDLELICDNTFDLIVAFNEWIATRGGATAQDNCTPDTALVWSAFESGTSNAVMLPPAICPAPDSIVRLLTVDFIVQDECGNRDTTTATFKVIDDLPPRISGCPQDTIIAALPGTCETSFVLLPPVIEEECAASLGGENVSASAPITTNAASGMEGETPVNSVVLNFSLSTPPPVNAFGNATLTIELSSVDGEEPTEFFRIRGEDGSLIGQTNATDVQCGSSTTVLTLTPAQINAWATDGVITIRLDPNIPGGQAGNFAINAICNPTGTVSGNLQFQTKNFVGLSYAYSLNDGPRIPVSPIGPVNLILSAGATRVRYYVTDCTGGEANCTYLVTVRDEEPPVLTCPTDITVALDTGQCTAAITLPLPLGVTDNCAAGSIFQQTLPTSLPAALLTFSLNPNLNTYQADARTYTFGGVAANAISDVLLTLDLLGDFDSNGAFFTVIGDDNNPIGNTTVGVATCNTPGQQSFTIPAATFNAWAADGNVQIRLQPNNIQVPPGMPGDGINPCQPDSVTFNGDNDGKSFALISLRYNQLTPKYFATGATEIPLAQMLPPQVRPTLNFNVGVTDVFYILEDESGNADTCMFRITVEDKELPVARCQPTTIFINPSGLEIETVPAMVIDAGSRDNCGIDTMFLTPNTFDCTQIGQNATVTLTVRDKSGNTASCQALVRIEAEEPRPTATTGLCGGDTLFLFANPPAATGGIIYTYRWTGPNGFFSTQRNPTINNVGAVNAGTYIVEVTGLTNCKSVGSVQVAIENLPLTPAIQTASNVCVNDDIVLNSSVAPSGSNVTYRWYRGAAPGGTLLGSTNVPSFTIAQPHAPGTNTYYLTIESDGCLSSPSAPVSVTTNSIPTAVVNNTDITVCEGEMVTLGTLVSGPGITYQWTGPNNYASTNQFPPVINAATPANAGVYRLVVLRNGCPSPPAFTVLNVLPKPVTPQITNTGPVCEGGNMTLSTTSTGASVYRWISPTLQEFLTTTNSFNINNITKAQEGAWRLIITQNGCNSNLSAATQVIVNTVPTTVASANPAQVCEDGQLQLFASPTITNATYRWTGPNSFMAATQNPVINNVTQNRAGRYEVTITTLEGCARSASVDVEVQRGVRITAVSNDGQACLTGPRDIRLAASLFPPNDGTYRFRWTGPGFSSSDSIAVIPNATGANNGNYQLVVTNGEGCSSQPATTIVDVSLPPATPPSPVISPGTPGPFCEGKPVTIVATAYSGASVVYRWNTPKGTVITDSPSLNLSSPTAADNGLYTITVLVDGCSSRESVPLGLNIGPRPQIFVNSNSPVCSGETIQLEVNAIPGATYAWTGPSGFTSSVANPPIPSANTIANSGVYRVFATLNGCVSNLDSVVVMVNPKPAAPTPSGTSPVCISNENAVLRLSASPISGATYTWYNQSGEVIGQTQSQNLDITDFEGYENGDYLFTVTATVNNCSSPLSTPVIVRLNTIPDKEVFAGDDRIVCEGDTIRLAGRAPTLGTGLWTLAGGNPSGVTITDPSNPASRVLGLRGDSTYIFRWTLSNGACINYGADEVALQITPLEFPYAGEDTVVCATDRVTLSALLPTSGIGQWTQPTSQQILGVRILNPNQTNTVIDGLQPGNLYTFTWSIVGGCAGMPDEIRVLTSDTEPFAGLDRIVCNDNFNAVLSALNPTDGSFGRWSSPDGMLIFSNERDPRATVSKLMPGENILIWTIDNALCGDNSRDTVRIIYKQNPIARPDDIVVTFGANREFDVLVNDLAPLGSVVSIISAPRNGTARQVEGGRFIYTPGINFVGTDQMTYEVCSEGCNCSTALVRFVIGENAQCDIPSIITPNGDGINDAFVIPCFINDTNFPRSQVLIFNRWGDEVFRSPVPYRNNWNGTFNGEDLPIGTYFYVVNFGDGSPNKTGFVMIQR